MDMIGAMRKTLVLAVEREFDLTSFDQKGVDYEHLKSMYDRVLANEDHFSQAKLGRWLGYIQGVLVATDTCTLEEMKEINREFADVP